ncbi:hypothetical protein JZU69_04540, partial [bacterium]|nr:hypothetical protein [bacterium]
AMLRAARPDLPVSLSSEISPEIREYERTSTTVINSLVGPPVRAYLQSLVGGDQALMGFTDSVMRNISTLTSLALDNMTSKQVAYHLQDIARGTGKMAVQRGKGNAGQDVVRFRQSPDPKVPKDDGWRHITVDTQGTAIEGIPTSLLVQSIAGTYSTLPGFAKPVIYCVLASRATRSISYASCSRTRCMPR